MSFLFLFQLEVGSHTLWNAVSSPFHTVNVPARGLPRRWLVVMVTAALAVSLFGERQCPSGKRSPVLRGLRLSPPHSQGSLTLQGPRQPRTVGSARQDGVGGSQRAATGEQWGDSTRSAAGGEGPRDAGTSCWLVAGRRRFWMWDRSSSTSALGPVRPSWLPSVSTHCLEGPGHRGPRRR